jgi:phage shock protein PspC (stress-responsive transcriptional regulator)
MKKNISINISGIIFHIEEDGYETLRKYLDSVNKYFSSFEDNSEILADIEGRIAEIFLSKLNDGKQVITAEDVSNLIATMGSVSDFKAAEEQEFAAGEPAQKAGQQKSGASSPTTPRTLMRDMNRKILGGVCAGIGHYFNIDPVWPRLLFVLLLFGYGLILLVYIIMWFVLPPSTEIVEEPSFKKMYRDPDKKVISGVASGIAAFFGTDISVIRLLFVVLSIFGGFGILLYIIMWIILPEAKTITEKMQMQGEAVTLSNIESTVKKGLNEKETGDESTLTKIILFPFRAIAAILNGLGKVLGPVFRVLVDILRVAIGLVVTLMGLSFMLCLIIAFGIMIGMFSAPSWELFSDWYVSSPNLPLTAIRNSFPSWMLVFTFFAAFIPALFVLLIGNSIIAKRIVFRPMFGWTLFVIFFVSAAVVSFSLPQMIYGFKEEGEYKVEESFSIAGKTPVLMVNETGMDDYDVTSINLKGYEGKDIRIIKHFQSQGASRKIAGENAKMIEYNVVQSDSVLTFDSNITFKPDAKFRAQRLDLDLMVPFNRPFVIDASLWRLIDTRVIDLRGYTLWNLNQETQTWKITDRGVECTSCPEKAADPSISTNDQFGLKDFNSVEMRGLFNVRIQKGDQYAVEVTGPESERKRYQVYVTGETLVVEYEEKKKLFWKRNLIDDDMIRINITLPQLRELDVTGAGKINFGGFDEDEMDIKLMGAVMADGELNANSLNIKLTGASFLDLKGNGRFMEADILGASGLRAYGYEVKHCIVEAHGASMAKVNVTETLEYSKGMASSVSHHGSPEVIKR